LLDISKKQKQCFVDLSFFNPVTRQEECPCPIAWYWKAQSHSAAFCGTDAAIDTVCLHFARPLKDCLNDNQAVLLDYIKVNKNHS